MLDLNTFIATYAFGPDNRFNGPLGTGRFVSVMQCWYQENDIMYCFVADDKAHAKGYNGEWVRQADVMDPEGGWEFVPAPVGVVLSGD